MPEHVTSPELRRAAKSLARRMKSAAVRGPNPFIPNALQAQHSHARENARRLRQLAKEKK